MKIREAIQDIINELVESILEIESANNQVCSFKILFFFSFKSKFVFC